MRHARAAGIVIVIGLSGLAAAAAPAPRTASKGVFRSPLGDFTVAIPRLALGAHVDPHFASHSGSVSFSSDLGEIDSIQSQEVDAAVAAAVADPARAPAALRRFLDEYVVPETLRKVAPRTTIVHGAPTTIDGKPAYFAIASMPEGSVVQNVETRKRADDTRGLLILGHGRYVYVVTVGVGVGVVVDEPKTPPAEEIAKLRRDVEAFYRRVTFTADRPR